MLRPSQRTGQPTPPRRPTPPGRPRAKRWLLAFIGAAAVGAAAFAWVAAHRSGQRSEGLLLAERRDFAAAEPLLLAAWRREPGDPELARPLAVGYLNASRPADAEDILNAWCAKEPDNPEPFRYRFAVRMRLDHKAQAVEDAARLLELGIDDPALGQQMGALFWKFGRPADSERAYRAALALRPSDPSLKFLVAESLHAQGAVAACRELLAPLARAYPTFAGPVKLLGMIERAEGRPAAAIPLLEKALALDPYDSATRYEYSLALGQVGRDEEARRQVAEQQKIESADYLAGLSEGQPDNPDLWVRAAQALFDTGRGDQARKMLSEVLRRNPNHAAARQLLAAHPR